MKDTFFSDYDQLWLCFEKQKVKQLKYSIQHKSTLLLREWRDQGSKVTLFVHVINLSVYITCREGLQKTSRLFCKHFEWIYVQKEY